MNPLHSIGRQVLLLAMLAIAPGMATAADGDAPRPGPGPGRFEITPTADSIVIPFEYYKDEFRLEASMNGQDIRMLIDNGTLWDQLLFFGSERVDALGMEAQGEAEVGGAGSGDSFKADFVTGVSIALEGRDGRRLVFHDQDAIITPYEPGQPNPWSLAEGQFSAQFFKHFVVEFDFDTGLMTLTRPEVFDPTGKGRELAIKPLPGSGSWSLPVAMTLHDGRRLELDVTMDLGWGESVAVTLGGAHDVAPPPGLEKTYLGSGITGPIEGYLGRIPMLEIAGYRLEDLDTTFSAVADGGAKAGEFMIGIGTFRRFNLTFDYQNRRMFFKANRSFGE